MTTDALISAMRSALSMTRQRCRNPKQRDYPRYGGKGVTFCARWENFDTFLSDMGLRPEGLTLERVDNAKGYEPGNCVWASRKVQSNNRDLTLKLTYQGVERTITEWAEITGVPYHTLKARHKTLGYADSDCLEKPVKCGSKLLSKPYPPRRKPRPETLRRGMAHPAIRLPVEVVLICRSRWSSGESFSALGREFNVSVTTMSSACQGLAAYSEVLSK